MLKPQISDPVQVNRFIGLPGQPGAPDDPDAEPVSAAIVTRVWDETDDGAWIVNVIIFLDGPGWIPWHRERVALYETAEQAAAVSLEAAWLRPA